MTDAPPTNPPLAEPVEEHSGGGSETPRRRSFLRGVVEWVVTLGVALGAAFLAHAFVVQAFFIPSASMEPELDIGDRVLVNKLSYRLHDVHRGDIVVFSRPGCDTSDEVIKDLIKRVVALGGERVEGRNGRVYVNGRALRESYLPRDTRTADFGPVTVPPGKLWVMGDNRANSKDSRFLCNNRPTFIEEDAVVGRAFVRVWPLGKFGGI